MADIFGRNVIDKFDGEYSFLSNFYPAPLMYEGRIYPSSEHAYQAAKCKNGFDRELFSDRRLTAGQAKRLGRKVAIRDGWDEIKTNVMYEIVKQKFLTNPDLGRKLKATGDDILIEGNTWGDKYWGQVDGDGLNRLGHILMLIRVWLV